MMMEMRDMYLKTDNTGKDNVDKGSKPVTREDEVCG